MRIAYVGDGASVHNHFMTSWFVEQGHDVLFLTDTPDPNLAGEVREVAPRSGGGWLRHIRAAFAVRKALTEWAPNILHAHNVTGYGYWAALSGFHPLVMTSWGSDLLVLPKSSPFVEMMVRWSLRNADLITADANSLGETARDLVGRPTDVRSLQWGVDLSEFRSDPPPDFRDRLRGDADFVFLSTRRLRPLYNIPIIIDAFASISPRERNARLVIVGEDELSDSLRTQAEQLSLEDRIYFTGWLSREELVYALLCCDAYLTIPSSDSTPLSLLEAFAARLPVIASDLPAIREWITPRENGVLVAPGFKKPLREAMVELISDPERALEWGRQNRAMVEQRADRNREMRKLLKWYQEFVIPASS